MKVKVPGHGMLEFPSNMTEEEVKAVLKQFEPKKDETVPKLLTAIEKLLKNQRPVVVTEEKIREVERPFPVYETKVVEVEKVVTRTTNWHFEIERDEEGMITNIYAEPYE